MNKYSVLIIDNDKKFCTLLASYLEKNNYLALVPPTIFQALKILKDNPPDLIILDVLLSEINGFLLLEKIRQQNFISTYIPIIILTSKTQVEDRIRGYRLGCNMYLSKPFNRLELLSITHNLIGQHYRYFTNFQIATNIKKNHSSYLKIKTHITPSNLNEPYSKNTYRIELSIKEQLVLDLLIVGKMNKEIAKYLKISTRNVEKYVARLLNKVGAQTRTELAQYAFYNTLYIKHK